MSLRKKLYYCFTAMALLCGVLGGLMVYSVRALRGHYLAQQRQSRFAGLAQNLERELQKGREALNGFVLGIDPGVDRTRGWESESRKILAQWDGLASSPQEKEPSVRMVARLSLLVSRAESAIGLVLGQRRNDAVAWMEAEVLPAQDALEREVRQARYRAQSGAGESWDKIAGLERRATRLAYFLLGSALLAGLGLSALIHESLAHPLLQMKEGARKIRMGDFQPDLDLGAPAEIEELARSFQGMASSLGHVQAGLLQTDRMAALTAFAGGVAHEINNPLTGVLGQSQLLLARLPEGPERAALQKIERAAQRCREVVRELLTFSRPGDMDIRAEDADAVLERTLRLLLSEMADQNVRLVRLRGEAPKVLASARHLGQVFFEVLSNALAAMPSGGVLTVETGMAEEDPSRPGSGDFFFNEGGDYVRVRVSDTGAGMTRTEVQHAFDPFFTRRQPGRGKGLGLSVCYGLVRRQRGWIRADSRGPGQGSDFDLFFPAAEEPRTYAAHARRMEKVLSRLEDKV